MDSQLSLWQKAYYLCYRFGHKLSPQINLYRMKCFIQRGHRGYSDNDCWGLDYHLYKIIPPMLRKLADEGLGVPDVPADESGNLTDERYKQLRQEWEAKLHEAADDIEAYYIFDELDLPVGFSDNKAVRDKYYTDAKAAQERTKKGYVWLSSHIFELWD